MSTLSAVLTAAYPVAEAERGKFAVVDMSTIAGYASGTCPDGWRGKRYAILTCDISKISSTGGTALEPQANEQVINSGTYTSSANVITYSPVINYLEFFNNSSNYTYFLVGSTSLSTVTSQGIPIGPLSFYSISREINAITFAPVSSAADLRIVGHYRV